MGGDGADGGGTERSRRQFLRGAGGVTSTVLTIPVVAGGPGAATPAPEDLRISGVQIVRTAIEPDAVTVHRRKISADLARRYDVRPPVLTTTETIDRPDPAADDLPRWDLRVDRRPWETYYAKEPEWRDVLASEPAGAGPTLFSGHDTLETRHPFSVYEYEEVGDGYEIAAPMNVVSKASKDEIVGVLEDDGWTGWLAEWPRFAWNEADEQFELQHQSAATAIFGILGRKHVKCWEFGDYVSCSAHVDSHFPHRGTSHEDAEQAIADVFAAAGGWAVRRDRHDVGNGSQLDHDGEITQLIEL